MKTKFLFAIFFAIFITTFVQASSVGVTIYFDSTIENSLEIIDGDSFGVMASFNKNSNVQSMSYSLSIYNDQSFSNDIVFGSTPENHVSFSDTYNSEFYNGPGAYTIEAIVVGSDGDLESKTLNLIVLPNIQENSAPVMINVVPYITIYPAVVSTSFEIEATDADNDDLTYELVQTETNGTVKIKGNKITYIPNANFFGIETIKYRAFDGTDYSEIATTKIERKDYANYAPVAKDMHFLIQEDEEIAAPFLVNDADDTDLTYYVRDANSGTIIIYHENLFRYNPSNGPGTFTYEYWANDGEEDSNHATITIIVNEIPEENTAPVVNNLELTMYQFEQVEIELDSYDAEGDQLIYTITMESGWERNTTDETITYSSGNALGTYTITYQAFDGEFFSNIGTITINVLEALDTTAPEITIISPEAKEYKDNDVLFKIEVNEDADLWFVIDGTNYTFQNSADGEYERTINNLQNKDYIVTFYARDLSGNVAEKSVEFSVDQKKNRNNDEDEENVLENSYVPKDITRRTIGLGAVIGFDNEMEESELNWLLLVLLLILLILFILILLIKKLRENKSEKQKVYTPKEVYY
ncbi:hypothetical protein HOD88_00025 [archaeon]|jgi:hypothetical protein|nr:hypothetical protein [archaeon]